MYIYIFVALVCMLYFFCFIHRCGPDGLLEWGIIELQGDLEAHGSDNMNGEFIGDLSYDKYGQPVCFNMIA